MGEDGGGEELPERVDAEQARALVAGGKVRVIDIRSAEDFAEERIPGSVRCDPDDVAEEIGNDPAEDREGVLILCEDGSRSGELAEEVRGEDQRVTSIDGGFKAWVGDHLPTAPNPDEEYEGPTVKLPGAVASGGGPEDEDDDDSGEAEPDEETAERSEER